VCSAGPQFGTSQGLRFECKGLDTNRRGVKMSGGAARHFNYSRHTLLACVARFYSSNRARERFCPSDGFRAGLMAKSGSSGLRRAFPLKLFELLGLAWWYRVQPTPMFVIPLHTLFTRLTFYT
jgi:hypothetical protein